MRKARYKTDDGRNPIVSFEFSEMSATPSRSTEASLWAGLVCLICEGTAARITVFKGCGEF